MPIKAEEVAYTYRTHGLYTHPALQDISFKLNEGEIVGIIGQSGAGKTTLLKLLNGLLKPDAGKIMVDGLISSALKPGDSKLIKKVGLVWQFPEQQLFESSVYQELSFGLKRLGLNPESEKSRIIQALSQVGLDYEQFQHRRPASLSSGEKRRLALACFLVRQPSYLLLDEALAGLDPKGVRLLGELLISLSRTHGTGIIVTGHNLASLSLFCSRIILLEAGRILLDTPQAELTDYYDILKKQGFTLPLHQEVLHRLQVRGWNINSKIANKEIAVQEIMQHLRRCQG